MRTPSIALAIALLFAGPLASAQQAGPSEAEILKAFAEIDTNQDGRVDQEEFRLRLVDRFYFADANRDGFLERAEFSSLLFNPDDFGLAERSGDQKVSLYEFTRIGMQIFESADVNDDGVLTSEEAVNHRW